MENQTTPQVTPPAKNMGPSIFEDPKPEAAPAPEPAPSVPDKPAPKVEPEAGPGSDGKAHGNEPEKPETKEPEKPAEQRIVPDKYDLKLSADSMLNASALQRLESYAKTEKLTNEEAQTLVKLQEQDVLSAVNDRKSELAREAQADKEIGGVHFKENVERASRFLEKHGTPELKAEFDRYGYGNHKEVIRLFAKLDKQLGNDQAVISRQHGSTQERPLHEMFYGPDTN